METIEIKVERFKTSTTNTQSQGLKIEYPFVFHKGLLISIDLLVMIVIGTTIYVLVSKHVHKLLFSFKPYYKVKCRSCQFFSSNSYLHCAVHPLVVLTKKAVDCGDYRPNKKSIR